MGPKCEGCDHRCENYLNEDGECWGHMTEEEREALNQEIIRKTTKIEVPKPKTKTEMGFTWD